MSKDKGKHMKINVNVMCRARLTKSGMNVLMKKQSYLFETSWWDGKTSTLRTELWNLMVIFGDRMHMGQPEPYFVDNNIEIEVPPESEPMIPLSAALKAVDDEQEFPGEMPDSLKVKLADGICTVTEALRSAVRLSKQRIRKRMENFG